MSYANPFPCAAGHTWQPEPFPTTTNGQIETCAGCGARCTRDRHGGLISTYAAGPPDPRPAGSGSAPGDVR
jgi:hypothetical protein